MRESGNLGSPSSHACLRAFEHGWTGCPKLFRCGRGTNNRSVFWTLAKNFVVIRLAGLEAPEQIGRVERRGAKLKKMMSKVIKNTHPAGGESMDMILSECLNVTNEMTRHGGFAPAQWVLSRLPRNPATMGDEDVSMWMLCRHTLMDQQLSVYSHITKQKHVRPSYHGTVVNESDVPLCERPHPWLDPTKLETLSRTAEKHEQANMDCTGALDQDC